MASNGWIGRLWRWLSNVEIAGSFSQQVGIGVSALSGIVVTILGWFSDLSYPEMAFYGLGVLALCLFIFDKIYRIVRERRLTTGGEGDPEKILEKIRSWADDLEMSTKRVKGHLAYELSSLIGRNFVVAVSEQATVLVKASFPLPEALRSRPLLVRRTFFELLRAGYDHRRDPDSRNMVDIVKEFEASTFTRIDFTTALNHITGGMDLRKV
jgi:hypothetical protein